MLAAQCSGESRRKQGQPWTLTQNFDVIKRDIQPWTACSEMEGHFSENIRTIGHKLRALKSAKNIMSSLLGQGGRYHFETVRMGLEKAGVIQTANSNHSFLKWHDSLKEQDYFSSLKCWQVTNRIPSLSVLTRKASLGKLINKVSTMFPKEYDFIPEQYILPDQYDEFVEMLKTTKKTWIVKPDEGSLGVGIQIVEPGQNTEIPRDAAVAQEYIESATLENKKFDLRVYVLIASVKPLRIYVYRDGLARFCSEEVGVDPVFSRLTNVTLNKQNDSNFKDISRTIADVFPSLQQQGVDIDQLWKNIDDAVTKTILSGINLITKAEQARCPSCGYSRCFQVLGFDILLDKQYKPYVLEVNYRPNLDFHRGVERRMKSSMICDAVKLAVPLKEAQSVFMSRKVSWNSVSWRRFLLNQIDLSRAITGERIAAEETTNFHKVFLSESKKLRANQKIYQAVMALPVEYVPGLDLPVHCIRGGEA